MAAVVVVAVILGFLICGRRIACVIGRVVVGEIFVGNDLGAERAVIGRFEGDIAEGEGSLLIGIGGRVIVAWFVVSNACDLCELADGGLISRLRRAGQKLDGFAGIGKGAAFAVVIEEGRVVLGFGISGIGKAAIPFKGQDISFIRAAIIGKVLALFGISDNCTTQESFELCCHAHLYCFCFYDIIGN